MQPRPPPITDADRHVPVLPLQLDRRRFVQLAVCAPAVFVVASCSPSPREGRAAPVPADMAERITVLGIPNGRFWADTQEEALVREAEQALERERAAAEKTDGRDGRLPPAYFLAVSGGGDEGPFGAGLLCGWSDTGTMPTFKLVTGISTGSMIAPFAFLGRSYIERLSALFSTIKPDDILKTRALYGLYGVVFGDALADTTPLYHLISHYVDEQMLTDITAAYSAGRLLLIGTASLDQQRPIIWNIGAIAASGRPGALELIRKVVLASASIPGAFPPVMINVEADGGQYQEMNVDGGVVAQTFLYPADFGLRVDLRSADLARERHAYVIRNSRLDPDWASVNLAFLNITERAIATMIHYIGYSDLLRIYEMTKHDGVDYNLAYIEATFTNMKHESCEGTARICMAQGAANP
jgi:predicted acylesterase/phospholipase RssA